MKRTYHYYIHIQNYTNLYTTVNICHIAQLFNLDIATYVIYVMQRTYVLYNHFRVVMLKRDLLKIFLKLLLFCDLILTIETNLKIYKC